VIYRLISQLGQWSVRLSHNFVLCRSRWTEWNAI